jgi:hypothetical protein
MFPTEDWDSPPTVGWENSPTGVFLSNFSQISGIGMLLD